MVRIICIQIIFDENVDVSFKRNEEIKKNCREMRRIFQIAVVLVLCSKTFSKRDIAFWVAPSSIHEKRYSVYHAERYSFQANLMSASNVL